eukprot:m.206826 g.206826  ORF g.206826 m.206826 type:complete len:190 (+) comp15437_c0_seq2:150-719(+)
MPNTAPTFEDVARVAKSVGELLLARGDTVAVSEATTGGLTNALLQTVSKSSRFSAGALCIYSATAAKALLPKSVTKVLFVPGYTSSPEVYRDSKITWVVEMARHVRQRFDADWAIAESGATTQIGGRLRGAGAFTALAVCGPDGSVVTRIFDSPDPQDRSGNMFRYSTAQLTFLEETIRNFGGNSSSKL